MKGLKGKKRQDKTKDVSISVKGFKWWHNLKVGYKYGVAFSITTILFCISAVIIFFQLYNVKTLMVEVEESGGHSVLVTEMAGVFNQLGSEISLYIQDSNGKHVVAFEDLSKEYDELAKQLKPAINTKELEQLFKQVDSNKNKLTDLFDEEVFPAVKAANFLDSTKASKAADETINSTVGILDQLRRIMKNESETAVNSANTNVSGTILVLLISIIVSTGFAIMCIMLIGKSLGRQFKKLIGISNSIAEGNLNVKKIQIKGNDEIGLLSNALNVMSESLSSMIREISSVSTQVSSKSSELMLSSGEVKAASQQVASTVQELSTGAEEQAHTSTLLAKMMDEYSKKINAANDDGSQVRISSLQVLELTQKGNKYMDDSTDQMSKINEIMESSVARVKGLDEQTKQISTLVKVIRDIADQTNLLALNAAIEAARAGDQGRGFAVVADEVRKLAEQVSHSVADITHIVGSIQSESNSVANSLQNGYREVDEGTKQIKVTGQTFKDINLAVSTMVERIQDISEHLDSVAQTTVEMNTSVDNIAAVSEQSAAGIEQTSASVQQTNSSMEQISDHAELLSSLADQLDNMISRFRL
ncbi:methyl-accepting chemotaxis protein [Ferdinandcohnia quinoae]|uniref:Methyl-accepting chemotaxis protein n=1 Tax=Fredinandcohnia quinoae TaxID=2918902 RepID=A0AAW5EBY7_9BACI|nr:methyl-accepting chemotaxis protein [Fredinandcohnia sp. SECRCQ15]MCH1627561.1 methyl-accepting chemotaxis protein [Fredinandcohnia sp. SECRCQ15]